MINGQNLLTQQISGGPESTDQSANGRNVSQPPGPKQNYRRNQQNQSPSDPFTTLQTMALEQEYTINHFLDRARRMEIANVLLPNQRNIKVWFQNRRMKEKKDRAEAIHEEISTSE